MELVKTLEISGEEREIADAYARGQIDGINSNLSVIGKYKNLLNLTFQTTTMNGIKCTNNGDGTYTLNGTVATGNYEQLSLLSNKISAGTYKLVGNPDYSLGCSLYFSGHGGKEVDYGNGGIVNFASDITTTNLYLYIPSGVTLTNVVFKPMITENLNATYDDFVPYTGDGETLTADVAEIKNDLSEKLKVISVSLSDVMVSAMSSTTVDLPQEYIDAGYVIANILSKPDTGLNYTTGSETSIIIRNNTDSAVAFAPTTTVKVLIAKIG